MSRGSGQDLRGPQLSYPPTLDELKNRFVYEHPGCTFTEVPTNSISGYSFPKIPVPFEDGGWVGWKGTAFTARNLGSWANFLNERSRSIASEAGVSVPSYSPEGFTTGGIYNAAWWAIHNYSLLCKNPSVTPAAKLERARMRELARLKEEERIQEANRQRVIAAEKEKQEAEKRQREIFQHEEDLSNVKEWAVKKIQEEKAVAERALAQKELAELFEAREPVVALRAQDFMTTAQFRSMYARKGLPLNADQHVCHIIAESKGGANHIDNYYIASGSLNQSLGNRNDYYLAEAAGLEQVRKAVAVSRTTGYTGPSAEELIAKAKAVRGRHINLPHHFPSLPQGHPAVGPAMPGGLPSSGWGPGRTMM